MHIYVVLYCLVIPCGCSNITMWYLYSKYGIAVPHYDSTPCIPFPLARTRSCCYVLTRNSLRLLLLYIRQNKANIALICLLLYYRTTSEPLLPIPLLHECVLLPTAVGSSIQCRQLQCSGWWHALEYMYEKRTIQKHRMNVFMYGTTSYVALRVFFKHTSPQFPRSLNVCIFSKTSMVRPA